MRHAKNFIDLSGQIFKHLTVISFSYTKKKSAYFKCVCSCGMVVFINGRDLRLGRRTSCGHAIGIKHRFLKHAFKDNNNFYQVWSRRKRLADRPYNTLSQI